MGIYASWLGALGVGFNPEHILSAEVPFKMFLRGPSFTDTLWSSEPQCSWAVPALSTLLRDGVQGAVWTEKPVLCRLGASTAHSHPEVQGGPEAQGSPNVLHLAAGCVGGLWLQAVPRWDAW